MDLYIHFPTRRPGVVLNSLGTGTTLSFFISDCCPVSSRYYSRFRNRTVPPITIGAPNINFTHVFMWNIPLKTSWTIFLLSSEDTKHLSTHQICHFIPSLLMSCRNPINCCFHISIRFGIQEVASLPETAEAAVAKETHENEPLILIDFRISSEIIIVTLRLA
jgi:hypothetical protein